MPAQRSNFPRSVANHEALLARLLPLWPHELDDTSSAGRERRVALLRRALRLERQRGLAGHWTYDLSRHSGLLACYRTETARLNQQLADEALKTSLALRQALSLAAVLRNHAGRISSEPASVTGPESLPPTSHAACQAPSVWPDSTARSHNWVPPSGNLAAGHTSPYTAPGTCYDACADAV